MIEKYIGYKDKRVYIVVSDVDNFEIAQKMANRIIKASLDDCIGRWAWVLNDELFFTPKKKAKAVWAFARRKKGEKEL